MGGGCGNRMAAGNKDLNYATVLLVRRCVVPRMVLPSRGVRPERFGAAGCRGSERFGRVQLAACVRRRGQRAGDRRDRRRDARGADITAGARGDESASGDARPRDLRAVRGARCPTGQD